MARLVLSALDSSVDGESVADCSVKDALAAEIGGEAPVGPDVAAVDAAEEGADDTIVTVY